MGPTALFDKSALQALNIDESVWFEAFLLANITPVFYVETLADLEKEVAEGRTPEQVVGSLAAKTPSDAAPNVHHRRLISAELLGQADVAMDGRAIVSAGEMKKAPDGTVGIHVDEFPEMSAFLRWKVGEFLEIERELAKGWREELAANDPDRMVGIVKNILPLDARVSQLGELMPFIESFCASQDEEVLRLALEILAVPDNARKAVVLRWERAGRPALSKFAPYSAHVVAVDLLYYLGIHRGFISSERASNKADLSYLNYLPFAQIFVSNDRLHARTAPLFLRDDQVYVSGVELKDALAEIDRYYDALPDEIKERGVLAFVMFPPTDLDNLVPKLWDSYMHPDWRAMAAEKEESWHRRRDSEEDRETVADLRSRIEGAVPAEGHEATLDSDAADYLVVRRQVPIHKGKWRMVPRAVEKAEED